MRNLLKLLVLPCLAFSVSAKFEDNLPTAVDVAPLRGVVVQYDGRYMPLDTLARDIVSKVTGTETFRGHDPVLVLLAWTFDPQKWKQVPLITIRPAGLLKELQLPLSRTIYSYQELLDHKPFRALVGRFEEPCSGGKPDPLETRVRKIHGKLAALQMVFQGEAIRFIPNADSTAPQAPWKSSSWLERTKEKALGGARQAWRDLAVAFLGDDAPAFAKAAERLRTELGNLPAVYRPPLKKIETELHYNRTRAYRKAWMIFALATVLAAAALILKCKWLSMAGGGVTLVGFVVFTHGLMQRWTIAGNIPASNMFESLLFLSWGAAGFAFVAFFFFRHRSVPLTASAIAALSLALADCLPIDHFIRPIAPVLQDTIWMSIHVPIIMISYAVLAIGVLVAHVQIATMAFCPSRKTMADGLDRLLYGYILAGSLLLLVGIVTGSVWAASSWGRYWGWDPKEVWSLVAFLGYMAIVHVRNCRRPQTWGVQIVGLILGLIVFVLVGIRLAPLSLGKILALSGVALALVYFFRARGQFAMAAKSILAFWLIIMTYVGVNYVLGTGMHSYGFGMGAVAARMCLIGAIDLGLLLLLAGLFAVRRRRALAQA
ncbi:MAG: cytochrome c biogenesis protein CcsA [Kiritimatiellaeota bacterium]|nr:cytochrome c biogenesis protein CcsA [Kiritimatiellota bacterium]